MLLEVFSPKGFWSKKVLSSALEGFEMARVVVVAGVRTPWSMSLYVNLLTLSNVVGFEAKTFP